MTSYMYKINLIYSYPFIQVLDVPRYGCYKDLWDRVESWEGGTDGFTKGYKYYGPQFNADGSVTWREWAPGAHSLHLQGEFSELTDYCVPSC